MTCPLVFGLALSIVQSVRSVVIVSLFPLVEIVFRGTRVQRGRVGEDKPHFGERILLWETGLGLTCSKTEILLPIPKQRDL
jgi:hypothetical protein